MTVQNAPPTISGVIRTPLLNKDGTLTRPWQIWFNELEQKTRGTIDSTGVVTNNGIDLSRSYANKNQDNIPDGTTYARTKTTQLTNGQVDFAKPLLNKTQDNVADGSTYARVASVQRKQIKFSSNSLDLTTLNANGTIVGSNALFAISGSVPNSATVNVSSSTMQFGFGRVVYSAGSVSNLQDSTTYYIYGSDPNYQGGAIPYQASTLLSDTFGQLGLIYFGTVTTPAFGGGGTSGRGGGGGGGRNLP